MHQHSPFEREKRLVYEMLGGSPEVNIPSAEQAPDSFNEPAAETEQRVQNLEETFNDNADLAQEADQSSDKTIDLITAEDVLEKSSEGLRPIEKELLDIGLQQLSPQEKIALVSGIQTVNEWAQKLLQSESGAIAPEDNPMAMYAESNSIIQALVFIAAGNGIGINVLEKRCKTYDSRETDRQINKIVTKLGDESIIVFGKIYETISREAARRQAADPDSMTELRDAVTNYKNDLDEKSTKGAEHKQSPEYQAVLKQMELDSFLALPFDIQEFNRKYGKICGTVSLVDENGAKIHTLEQQLEPTPVSIRIDGDGTLNVKDFSFEQLNPTGSPMDIEKSEEKILIKNIDAHDVTVILFKLRFESFKANNPEYMTEWDAVNGQLRQQETDEDSQS